MRLAVRDRVVPWLGEVGEAGAQAAEGAAVASVAGGLDQVAGRLQQHDDGVALRCGAPLVIGLDGGDAGREQVARAAAALPQLLDAHGGGVAAEALDRPAKRQAGVS